RTPGLLTIYCCTVFDWIKQVIGNGETCYFWSITIWKHLKIPSRQKLSQHWNSCDGDLGGTMGRLPPARSEPQVNILSYLATLSLTNDIDRLLTIYCIWAERNGRLHINRFRHPSAIIKEIDKTIKLRIAAIRIEDQQFSSSLFQAWRH
ncbi:LOW QUALITY PROTEIN: hypothetical protein HID58_090491, partial [Brassica napus]